MRDAFRIVMRASLVFLSASSSLKRSMKKGFEKHGNNRYTLFHSVIRGDPTLLTVRRNVHDRHIYYHTRHQPGGSVTRSARRDRVQASRRIMQNGAGLPAAAPTCTDRSIYRTGRPPRG
ncbi:hypothetical protein ALC53_08910 [Atta colombica]|uniref:Uncharacterized protein n=1 Tax=Atta colombica TaxID=520822 RepID=A0A195B8A7_9HYME|nr:hypothetical protein ALC53_08910 [Atta colombica]